MARLTGLPTREHQAVLESLRAPAMWAFQLLAGEVGFDRAVEACGERAVPADAVPAFDACGYTARDLPEPDTVDKMVKAARIKLAWKGKVPLQRVARDLGMDLAEAHACLRVYDALGSRLEFPRCS